MIASVSPNLSLSLLLAALPAEGVPLDDDPDLDPEPTDTPVDMPPPSPPYSANTGDEDDDIEYIGTSPLSAIKDAVTQKVLCKRHLSVHHLARQELAHTLSSSTSRSTPHGSFPPTVDPSYSMHTNAKIATLTRTVYANHVKLCYLTRSSKMY